MSVPALYIISYTSLFKSEAYIDSVSAWGKT